MELLAGITAQRLILGIEAEKCTGYGSRDFAMMGATVSNMFDNTEAVDNYSKVVIEKVFSLFRQPLAQRQIKAVADALMVDKTLSGKQVIEIMKNKG